MTDGDGADAPPTRVAVTGASGVMGGQVLAVAAADPAYEVVVAVSRSPGDVDPPDGTAVADEARLAGLLTDHDPDAVVDFTAPAATRRYAAACAETGTPLVTGTTGFDGEGEAALTEAAARTPVLRAANFSRGVLALRRAVREAVTALPGADVEVTETHHSRKRDAPSGTARTILDDVDEARGEAADRVHGREGETPRSAGEVGVHARRAGGLAGEHEVLIAEGPEAVTLSHRSESRATFAAGALDAAAWLAGRAPGTYEFGEVLD
ncbi:MAG: 4-hydroxy-tetrahydrodipicolinate reductase [Haloferacaceae archaeon]